MNSKEECETVYNQVVEFYWEDEGGDDDLLPLWICLVVLAIFIVICVSLIVCYRIKKKYAIKHLKVELKHEAKLEKLDQEN